MDEHSFPTHGGDMKVFIVGLWGTEACGPGKATLEGFARLIQEVDTRTEDEVFNQVVFVQAESGQQGEVVHLPFVLEEGTGYLYFLAQVASVAGHLVVHLVMLVLQTGGEGGR